jgi:hypothetical protein
MLLLNPFMAFVCTMGLEFSGEYDGLVQNGASRELYEYPG